MKKQENRWGEAGECPCLRAHAGCTAGWSASLWSGGVAPTVELGTGITLSLLLLCGGLLLYDAAGLERDGAGTLCACLCGGGLAGVLALPRKKKRRR